MNPPAISTHQLAIGYQQGRRTTRRVLDEITVQLHTGELVCLLGPNGAGKSTLMRTLAGMQPPLAGEIWLGADPLAALSPADLARRLSIVLTDRLDVGMLSVYALVALGRHPYTNWSGKLSRLDEVVVQQALTAVQAAHLAERYVGELSDGERQKVMIARALAQEPEVILLDEPTAYLDLPHRVEILRILHQLAREEQRAVLLSTHDLDLALRSADKIWLLPPGGPLHVGTPEDLVLNGVFATAFQRDGVQFDAQTGSFQMTRPFAGQVAVQGEGLAAYWTRRALERAGYAVLPSAPITIVVLPEHEWRLQTSGQTQTVHSMEALLALLQAALPI